MQDKTPARSALALICSFALSFALIFAFQDIRLFPFDENIILVDAQRTLNGDLIHRDFYSVYGPAANYIVAALFKLSSHQFFVGRIYGIAWMAGIVATVHALLLPRVQFLLAAVFSTITAAWMMTLPFYLYPTFPALLFMLTGSWLLLRSLRTDSGTFMVLAGCTAGLASLFRYDAGFFELVAHGAALAIIHRLGVFGPPSLKSFLLAIVRYGIGTLATFLPFAVYYLAVAPLSDFWIQIIDYGSHYYSRMRALPFPGLTVLAHPSELGIYLPFASLIIGGIELARWDRRRSDTAQASLDEAPPIDGPFVIVMMLLAGIMIFKGAVRASPIHMIGAIVPANLVLATAADRAIRWKGQGSSSPLPPLLIAVIPVAFALHSQFALYSRPSSWMLIGRALNDAPASCPLRPGVAPAVVSQDYAVVADYLRRNSKSDEPIFVGLDRHDKIFVNSLVLYFLADRRPGTRWQQMDPGLQTRSDIQRQMIEDLGRNRVRWVVRDSSFSAVNEPNGSSRSSGVHLLDDYLSANYRPVAASGPVQLWLRRGETAPRLPLDGACSPKPM